MKNLLLSSDSLSVTSERICMITGKMLPDYILSLSMSTERMGIILTLSMGSIETDHAFISETMFFQ